VSAAVYAGLSRTVEQDATAPGRPLSRSRRVVLELSALFSLDSFGGGFVVQSLLALYLFRRFALSLETAAAFFFAAGTLAAQPRRCTFAVRGRLPPRPDVIRLAAHRGRHPQGHLRPGALRPLLPGTAPGRGLTGRPRAVSDRHAREADRGGPDHSRRPCGGSGTRGVRRTRRRNRRSSRAGGRFEQAPAERAIRAQTRAAQLSRFVHEPVAVRPGD